MVKTNTTISLDNEVKERVKEILKRKSSRYNFSLWVEEMCRKMIEQHEKEVKK